MKTWTFSVDPQLEKAAKWAMSKFGYRTKAELLREALREFFLRRGLFSLVGEGQMTPLSNASPEESLRLLRSLGFSSEEVQKAIKEARDETEKLIWLE